MARVGAAGPPDRRVRSNRWARANRCVLPFEIPEWFPNNVARNSPVACSNIEFASLELQRLWAISKNDRVKLRAKFGWGLSRWRVSAPQALRTVGRAPIGGFFRLKYRSGSPAMSHVIPLWLVQTLNLHRWNCNVCGLSRKMTELNYVRNLSGGFLADACRRVLARVSVCLRVSAPQLAAWTSGPSGAACASLWLDGRCMLPDLSPFYGTASASNIPGPLVPQWGYVPALDTVTAWSQFRTT